MHSEFEMEVDEEYAKEEMIPIENEIKCTIESIINKIEIGKLSHNESQTSTDDESWTQPNSCPFIFDILCHSCKSTDSIFWRRVTPTKIVCNKCFLNKIYLLVFCDKKHEEETEVVNGKKTRSMSKKAIASSKKPIDSKILRPRQNQVSSFSSQMSSCSSASSYSVKLSNSQKTTTENNDNQNEKNPRIRKSTRSTKKPSIFTKSQKLEKTEIGLKNEKISELENESRSVDINEKSRRTRSFKEESRPPSKCETLVSTVQTSEFVFHRGFYIQIGDIVALFDLSDKDQVYFAQIRAFLTDQYGKKSAVITWLIPVDSDYAKRIKTAQDFEPDKFILGPAEEFPRPLECMEFVCRLVDFTEIDRFKKFDEKKQFQNDLLRHKFALNDLAQSNLKIITKNSMSDGRVTNVEHEVKRN